MRQYTDWIQKAETLFELHEDVFEADKKRILFASQFLADSLQIKWMNERKTLDAQTTTWGYFKEFLHNLIEEPITRRIGAAIRYTYASQRPTQNVYEFASYMEAIEAELDPYGESHLIDHLLTRLRPELRKAITNCKNLPSTRTGVIALAARIESNQRGAGVLDSPAQRPYDSKKKTGYPKAKAGAGRSLESRIEEPMELQSEDSGKGHWHKSSESCWHCHKKDTPPTTIPRVRDEDAGSYRSSISRA